MDRKIFKKTHRPFRTLLVLAVVMFAISSCKTPEETNPPYQGNSYPVFQWLEKDPWSINVGDTATFKVYAEDPDGDYLTYSWSIPEWWETYASFYTYFGNPVKFFADTFVVIDGHYRAIPFKVDIYDSWQWRTTYWDSIYVYPRQSDDDDDDNDDDDPEPQFPPTIRAIIPEKDMVSPLEIIDIFSSVTDPDNATGSLEFEWSYNGGYLLENHGRNMVWQAPHDPASYKIKLTVIDPQNNSDTDSIYVRVQR